MAACFFGVLLVEANIDLRLGKLEGEIAALSKAVHPDALCDGDFTKCSFGVRPHVAKMAHKQAMRALGEKKEVGCERLGEPAMGEEYETSYKIPFIGEQHVRVHVVSPTHAHVALRGVVTSTCDLPYGMTAGEMTVGKLSACGVPGSVALESVAFCASTNEIHALVASPVASIPVVATHKKAKVVHARSEGSNCPADKPHACYFERMAMMTSKGTHYLCMPNCDDCTFTQMTNVLNGNDGTGAADALQNSIGSLTDYIPQSGYAPNNGPAVSCDKPPVKMRHLPWSEAKCKSDDYSFLGYTGEYCDDSTVECADTSASCNRCMKEGDICCGGTTLCGSSAMITIGVQNDLEFSYSGPSATKPNQMLQCSATNECELDPNNVLPVKEKEKNGLTGDVCTTASDCAYDYHCCSGECKILSCDSYDYSCFARDTAIACRTDDATPVELAYDACFGGGGHMQGAEPVLMEELSPNDLVLTATTNGLLAATRVLANQHKSEQQFANFLTLTTADGAVVSLTPDHAIYLNGTLRAARDATLGATLTDAFGRATPVTRISTARGPVINPVTAAGTLLAGDSKMRESKRAVPVLAAAHPMWLAPFVLSSVGGRILINAALYVVGDVVLPASFAAALAAKVVVTFGALVLTKKAFGKVLGTAASK
jgi:hypothetical protein